MSKGGGCAILCDSSKILSKFVTKLNGNGFEVVCIDLYSPIDMRVICIYRAPWCNKQTNSELFNCIYKFWTVNMLIVGDFNFFDIDWQRLTAKMQYIFLESRLSTIYFVSWSEISKTELKVARIPPYLRFDSFEFNGR